VLINPLLIVEHITGPGVLEVFLGVVVLRVFDAILRHGRDGGERRKDG
jgi:hypothetical protein